MRLHFVYSETLAISACLVNSLLSHEPQLSFCLKSTVTVCAVLNFCLTEISLRDCSSVPGPKLCLLVFDILSLVQWDNIRAIDIWWLALSTESTHFDEWALSKHWLMHTHCVQNIFKINISCIWTSRYVKEGGHRQTKKQTRLIKQSRKKQTRGQTDEQSRRWQIT